jgi:TPP-dependent trihydroxycyclohexane-1,2-dione (THcHDO) dehydratase
MVRSFAQRQSGKRARSKPENREVANALAVVRRDMNPIISGPPS